jgi:hypothetical protein
MAEYKPDLPPGVTLPPGFKIDVSDARFVALREMATREKLSQAGFSSILAVEAGRVNAEYERARAAPAPSPAPAPAAKPDFSRMSTRDKLQYALENPRR